MVGPPDVSDVAHVWNSCCRGTPELRRGVGVLTPFATAQVDPVLFLGGM